MEPRSRIEGGHAITVCSDGRVLDAHGAPQHGVPSFLYVRSFGSYEVESVVDGVAPPIAAHPSLPFLLCSRDTGYTPPQHPLPQVWHGADVRLIDFDRAAELDRFPLQAPFGWLSELRFVSCSMGYYHGRRAIDPTFEGQHEQLQELFTDSEADGLAVVDAKSGKANLVVRCGVYGAWSRIHRAQVRDGVLYHAGYDQVGALRVSDGTSLWSAPRRSFGLGGRILGLGLSVDGQYLAVIGGSFDTTNDVVIVSAQDGRTVVSWELGVLSAESGLMRSKRTEATSMAWHPSGWLAVGMRSGLCARVKPSGEVSIFRGADTAIDALGFSPTGDEMLVASRSPGLGVLPLLDEER